MVFSYSHNEGNSISLRDNKMDLQHMFYTHTHARACVCAHIYVRARVSVHTFFNNWEGRGYKVVQTFQDGKCIISKKKKNFKNDKKVEMNNNNNNNLRQTPKNWLKDWRTWTIRGQVKTIQTTSLLRSARILRRVLENWGDLLSLKLQRETIKVVRNNNNNSNGNNNATKQQMLAMWW